MTARELKMIRPWLDPERQAIDVGYAPPLSLQSRGLVRFVIDDFYELTEKGKREAEKLIGRPL